MTDALTQNRRGEDRHEVQTPVEVRRRGHEPFQAVMLDLSQTGARLRMMKGSAKLARGDVLNLAIRHDGGETPKAGRVAWATEEANVIEIGVEFAKEFAAQAANAPNLDGPLDLDAVKIDPAFALRVPPGLAVRRRVLPFAQVGGVVHVAMADPDDERSLAAVGRFVGSQVRGEPAEPVALDRALKRLYGTGQGGTGYDPRGVSIDRLIDRRGASIDEAAEDDPAAMGDQILDAAALRQASDIHLDATEDALRLRMRIDGTLEPLREFPRELGTGIINRFKVMAGMDIAERRAPQDGQFRHESRSGQAVDVRAATLPTRHGERMTLRLLAADTAALTLEKLGMSPSHLALFEEAIDKPHGLILLTGPTGSGKSTTLYAAIRRLISQRSLNVLTIEDPVEYDIDGVAQVAVDHAQKVTFAKALRSVLRHDPDVIMVGEIRDAETADVAVKAALTGHLVFSTLHTNSAAGVITRLRDMGVPPYLTAATLRLAVAQRLVRQLCPRCRRPSLLDGDQASQFAAALAHADADEAELGGQTVYEPAGCMYCANRGFIGRIALFEALPNDGDLAELITSEADGRRLTAWMKERGLPTLAADAAEKVLAGRTSADEVLRAVTVF